MVRTAAHNAKIAASMKRYHAHCRGGGGDSVKYRMKDGKKKRKYTKSGDKKLKAKGKSVKEATKDFLNALKEKYPQIEWRKFPGGKRKMIKDMEAAGTKAAAKIRIQRWAKRQLAKKKRKNKKGGGGN